MMLDVLSLRFTFVAFIKKTIALPIALYISGLLFCTTISGQQVIRIAAVINEEIVSVLDIENRARLVTATANLRYTPEFVQRIKPQLLKTMIRERLQLQEASRLKISVTPNEIKRRFSDIARQNGMNATRLNEFLTSRGIDPLILEEQIRARLAWLKLINRQLSRQVSVGREQIKEEFERLKKLRGRPKLRLAEIFLTVDTPEAEQSIRETAERLINQVRNGASFPALAREFSQSTTAGIGGDLGWITDSELEKEMAATVINMKPGDIAPPIRTLTGYHILFLIDRRPPDFDGLNLSKVKYRQLIVPIAANSTSIDVNSLELLSKEISNKVRSCESFVEIGKRVQGIGMEVMRVALVSEASGPFKKFLEQQKIGVPTPPQRVDHGFVLMVVCSRVSDDTGLPSPDELEQRLKSGKLELLAQRYIRDLRREAYVEER